MQEKKPTTSGLKNANESKRLEKEYKRLQLELSKVDWLGFMLLGQPHKLLPSTTPTSTPTSTSTSDHLNRGLSINPNHPTHPTNIKERENYAQMHKALNQEIQTLKEDLDKREQEMIKFKSVVNSSLAAAASAAASSAGNGDGGGGVLVSVGGNLGHLNTSPMNSTVNLSSYSIASSINHFDDTLENGGGGGESNQDRLENWLSIPNKRNIKKHGWKKLYVVLRKGKLFFYNSLKDNKESQEPYMTIDLE